MYIVAQTCASYKPHTGDFMCRDVHNPHIHTAGVASSKLASPTKIFNDFKHLEETLGAFLLVVS